MLRRSFLRRTNLNVSVSQDLHRYSNSTFHDGVHRQAPGDSTPWRDVSTPFHKLKGWWLAPAAKGSIIAAWSITVVCCTYAYSLQQDAKSTYMMNNVLLSNLHQESLRADASQSRAKELQNAVKAKLASEEKKKGDMKKTLEQCADSREQLQSGIVSYELELSRERARGEIMSERNQALVKELQSVRHQLAQANRENVTLATEIEKLRKVVKRFETV